MFKRLDVGSLSKRKDKLYELRIELKADVSEAVSQVDESISKLETERTELARLQGTI